MSRARAAGLKQLGMYLEVYKHHFDLFFKGVVLYLAVVGALGGYVFTSDVGSWQKAGLASFITLGSLVAVWACRVCRGWVHDLEACVHRLEEGLGDVHFPFSGAYGVLKVMTLTIGLFAAAGFVHFVWFLLA